MRQLATITAAISAIAATVLSGSALAQPYFDVEIDAGSFYNQADGSISSGADRVGVEDDLGFDNEFNATFGARWSTGLRWLPGIGVRYTEAFGEGARFADSTYELLGVETEAGRSATASVLDFDITDAFIFYPGSVAGFNVQAGIGARFFDGYFVTTEFGSQTNADGSTQFQVGEASLGTSVAMLHLWSQRTLVPGLTIGAYVGGTPEPNNKVIDTEAWIQAQPLLNTPLGLGFNKLGLRAGYRYVNFDLDDEPGIDYDLDFSGPFASLIAQIGDGVVPLPADSDGDGVADPSDRCQGTEFGAIVDRFGCRPDLDGDGVPDEIDRCLGTLPGVAVDGEGCMLDADGDGVPDGQDLCPETPLGFAVDSNGCALDTDRDGVVDALDECPNTAPGMIVNERGCPADSDQDGVPDSRDDCPNTPPGVEVNARGCIADEDGDGVFDSRDRCPGTIPGLEVDEFGCAIIKEQEVVLPDINFEFNSAVLTADSLIKLTSVINALYNQEDLNVEIQGHTDNVGSDAYNLRLSQQRAASVVEFLVASLIDPNRLSAIGYGESRPVATNETEAGRAENRRVVLRVLGE